ncbi:uncharacterized protein EV420DRAFT_1767751, partial [Desarmillaria tabescens]
MSPVKKIFSCIWMFLFVFLSSFLKIIPLRSHRHTRFLFSSSYNRFPTFLVVLLWVLFFSLPQVSASVSSFTTFSVNVNGFRDVAKHSSLSNIIHTHHPHAWVFSETKSHTPVSSRMDVRGYKIFESPGLKTNARSVKWGILAGVHSSLATQQVQIPSDLSGRVLAIDIVLPTTNGHGFVHRLIGLYAPYDPGTDSDRLHTFWQQIRTLCQSALHSWQIIGDCNATVSSCEVQGDASGSNNARLAYHRFLDALQGIDVWSRQGDNDARYVWTYQAYNGTCRSILDRCAHSSNHIIASSIKVPGYFVPGTDHRLIVTVLHCGIPNNSADSVLLPPTEHPVYAPYRPRFLFPKRQESHRFKAFADRVDGLVHDAHLVLTPIQNDDQYQKLYSALSQILQHAAEDSFELPHLPHMGPRKPRNSLISLLLREYSRVNRLISAIKRQTLHILCTHHQNLGHTFWS